jgi:MoaA/NifB/PqqE/SkfB family radical SAM enzyme
MKAKLIENEAPGGKRSKLAEALPLATPYVVQFFPIYACNFHCKYCFLSVPSNERPQITDVIAMDMERYKAYAEQLCEFPDKIRKVRFVGLGEPLLHKNISDMVATAKNLGFADTVEILSNGSLLTKEMTEKLIEAGLDRLVVSIQGTSERKYRDISGVELDFDNFVDNLRCFYEHKKSAHLHLKIIDIALDGEDDKRRYLKIFGDVCDTIGIEYASPIFDGVAMNKDLHTAKTQFGWAVKDVRICPQAFFTMQINPNGNVLPCYAANPPVLGSADINTLYELWNGEAFNGFRGKMLTGRENVCEYCRDCRINEYRLFPEDDLEPYKEELKERYYAQ